MNDKQPWYKRLYRAAKEFFSDSSGSSICGAFIAGYYTYLGILLTVLTASPAVFIVWAMPAIMLFIIVGTESWLCSRI